MCFHLQPSAAQSVYNFTQKQDRKEKPPSALLTYANVAPGSGTTSCPEPSGSDNLANEAQGRLHSRIE